MKEDTEKVSFRAIANFEIEVYLEDGGEGEPSNACVGLFKALPVPAFDGSPVEC